MTNMSIQAIKEQFHNGQISKKVFIDLMHDKYKVLFDFSKNLSSTEIENIEIKDNDLIFTSRKSAYHPGGAMFFVDILDKRITPFEAFSFNQYELEDSEMLYRLVKNNDIIFDIGANIGWYSIHLSKKLIGTKIYSFEPIPETFSKLKKNVELNSINNINLVNLPLSNEIQNLIFYYSPSATGASSSVNISEENDIKKLECTTDTIDNFVTNNKIVKIDFIKCDVEGSELFVFQGGIESIKKYSPVIFTEMLRKWALKFNYHPNDIINLLKSMGYKCFYSSNGKLKEIDVILEDTIPTNFFFLHSVIHTDLILKNS
jgi:FkbM family methyltransferase